MNWSIRWRWDKSEHRDPLAHILSRCTVENGCWVWQGLLNRGGYGRIAKHTYGEGTVHRYTWRRLVGEIPDDLVLDHICRNRRCCNPTHLRLMTIGENVAIGESPSAVANRTNICLRGHSLDDAFVRNGKRNCRTCSRERDRQRYANNPEPKKARVKAYRTKKRQQEGEQ